MNFGQNRGLPLASLLWIIAIAAALAAAFANGLDIASILPFAAIAVIPAAFSALIWPFSKREWVQMAIIFAWIALAIVACFAISFNPMAALFLCAPAIAAVFEREKVMEATVLSAISAAFVFFVVKTGQAPEPIANFEQAQWGQLAGTIATVAFMIGAMFFASNTKQTVADPKLERMAGFAEAFPGSAMQFSEKGKLLLATEAARSTFGLSRRNVENMALVDLFAGDQETVDILTLAFDKTKDSNEAQKATIEVNTNVDDPDTTTVLELDFVPHEDGSIYLFATDSSGKVARLVELEQLQDMAHKEAAEKTLFFAGVSHELRTPLNAIIGFSDMMRSRLFGPLPGKYAEYADLIHDSGQHMLDLIGDVLDISKVEAGKYELNYDEFDVADVVRSSMKMVRPSADAGNVTLDADIDANTDIFVEADRRALRQILLNLLSNAIKFTPKGGRVVVSVKTVKDVLNIMVEDNGSGMTKEEVAEIGTPFSQAGNAKLISQRGSGLGLSLVKTLVQLHKGRFALTSNPGSGTSVNIYLPLRQPSKGDGAE